MNSIHSPQCEQNIEAIVTNLVEIRKEELAKIQSLIGIGLARIAKAKNLTSMPGDLTLFTTKQNGDRV